MQCAALRRRGQIGVERVALLPGDPPVPHRRRAHHPDQRPDDLAVVLDQRLRADVVHAELGELYLSEKDPDRARQELEYALKVAKGEELREGPEMARLLLTSISARQHVARRVILDTQLVVRQSSGGEAAD